MSGNKALSTWSGYDHQGIVALIVAIDRIKEYQSAGKSLAGYYLGLEKDEDFEIGIFGERPPLEAHQVKAKASSPLYSSYSPAVKKLKEDSKSEKKFLHSMILITDWPSSETEVVRYEYSSGTYHIGEDVSDVLLERVKDLMGETNPNHPQLIMALLQSDLTRRVCQEHSKKKRAKLFNLQISFEEIFQIIDTNHVVKKAQLFEIQDVMWQDSKHFFKKSEEFKGAPGEIKAEIIDFVTKIYGFDLSKFESFLEMVSPHHLKSKMTTHGYYTKAGWQDIFLKILTGVVNRRCDIRKGGLPIYSKDGAWYAPSLIDNENDYDDAISVAVQKNISAARISYEANVIITRGIEKDLFLSDSVTNSDYKKEEVPFPEVLSQVSSSYKPKNPKSIRLSSRDKTITELNS